MSTIQSHLGILRQIRGGELTPRECMQSVEFQRHAALLVASHLDELVSQHGTEEPGPIQFGLPDEWFTKPQPCACGEPARVGWTHRPGWCNEGGPAAFEADGSGVPVLGAGQPKGGA